MITFIKSKRILFISYFGLLFIFISVLSDKLSIGYDNELECKLSKDLSPTISSILCAVESKRWKILLTSTAIMNAGCLLGNNRCDNIMDVPTEKEILPSEVLPSSKNQQYQSLSLKAEELVPTTWWRAGFSNDLLLLTKKESDSPRSLFNSKTIRNKKLKQIFQCVTRQQFIRKSYDFNNEHDNDDSKCNAMDEVVVKSFYSLWKENKETLGGEFKFLPTLNRIGLHKGTTRIWQVKDNDDGKILVAAIEVLDHFYEKYGGIWTGCFKLIKSGNCRGALAAAAQVASVHFLSDCINKKKDNFQESHFVSGYMLASLGRGLLHGDISSTGSTLLTKWELKTVDFIALQAAFQKLYIDSFGKIYNTQLDKYIPIAFPPTFEVQTKNEWKFFSNQLEPVYTSLRNWMFTEASNLIDFGPYLPLVAFPEVRNLIIQKGQDTGRRILIDVGANGFFASPKYLLDSYTPYLPFTHVIMIEPEPHFSATVPKAYISQYNITFLQIYAEVNTGSEVDMIQLLPKYINENDFVVLKFDVDPNRYSMGPTMEWGFLFSIMQHPVVAKLIDETYIELHFHFPALQWSHYHSNWEALDAIRYLRNNGAIVHAWP